MNENIQEAIIPIRNEIWSLLLSRVSGSYRASYVSPLGRSPREGVIPAPGPHIEGAVTFLLSPADDYVPAFELSADRIALCDPYLRAAIAIRYPHRLGAFEALKFEFMNVTE